MLRIGITGGIGSGKSTAARFFKERGAQVFDADVEAKLILQHHQPTRKAVIEAFGEAVLNKAGEIDFGRLAAYAFSTPEQQQQLNDIVHHEVIWVAKREFATADQKGAAIFIVDAPLLFEAHLEHHLDYTLALVADEELRVERTVARGILTEEDIRKRMRLQFTDEERAARANFVVQNNGTLEELHEQLQAIYDSLPIQP
ncbi:MAG: dephospho-CoA kinase [Fidelibacterota bacterium]|nr:MAG: dephospho-CoA kinase [Candidatus Neomarinimicrobiota bacterium]